MPTYKESYAGKINRKLRNKQRLISVAMGQEPADLVLKNASYLNVFSQEICTGDIAVAGGLIAGIGDYSGIEEVDVRGKIVCPGLIDGHIHLESSLVSPTEFSKAVLPHGTTTVITDPHEIANVMGTNGIEYMLEATEGLPIDVHFMLPSCVPATPQDESGAVLDYHSIDSFYDYPRVLGLAEMMNFVGVVNGAAEPMEKIVAAHAHHKKIDGHAPGITDKTLNAYIAAGIYSDHECANLDEALEKLRKGQFIMIREGTAARNLEALAPLLKPQYASRCLFATDDKHPNDLLSLGHIDYIVRKAISLGTDPMLAVTVATHNAARYFGLNNKGAIAPGYIADFTVVDSLESFQVEQVFKRGKLRCKDGKVLPFELPKINEHLRQEAGNSFHTKPLSQEDFMTSGDMAVIGMIPGEIISTDCGRADGIDTANDILKIAVVERHHGTGHIGMGYLKGYGLKRGAVATSISHDSHNIIVVGTNEKDMAQAADQIVNQHGGIAVVEDGAVAASVQLEIAGLMSERPLQVVNWELEQAKKEAFARGVSQGIDPFMTLSFMSLPVIPQLRVTTQGVIDVMSQTYL